MSRALETGDPPVCELVLVGFTQRKAARERAHPQNCAIARGAGSSAPAANGSIVGREGTSGQVVLDREAGCRSTGTNLEFSVDRSQMLTDGSGTDVQLRADFDIGQALGGQP